MKNASVYEAGNLTIMCEFKVLRKGRVVFKDAVYAKADGENITVRDVLGVSQVFENSAITEVDVSAERLILASTKKR